MSSFLGDSAESERADEMRASDRADHGYVMNLTEAWTHQPALHDAIRDLIGASGDAAGLSFRQRGVVIAACASTLGDSYCSLAWGTRLAGETSAEVAAGVVAGDDSGLDPADAALARWARLVATDPSATTEADVDDLRAAGFDDARILAVTAFVAARLAFSTINGAVGARPDAELAAAAPAPLRAQVTYGRPPT
jgi:alkylhydroperoxidase family enzyme